MSDQKWAGVPVAWAAVAPNGQPMWLGYDRPALPIGERTVPLYRHAQPTLTDAEREAVVRAWHGLLKLAHHEPSLIDDHLAGARALNALLERTRNG